MSRPVPSWETLDAISRALDAHDRRSPRPTVPVLSGPARPLMPSEIVARLRGIRRECHRANEETRDALGLALELAAVGILIGMLADRIEGLRPVELEDLP
jgi:hypothetical protein